MRTTLSNVLACLCLVHFGAQLIPAADPELPAGLRKLKLLYADDFESDATRRWEPTDPQAWKLERIGDTQVYSQFQRRSRYEPPVRSPYNRSLLREVSVGDLVLDVRLQSTIPDYGHRDLCLFFGYQDAAHFYYVHLGKKADDHANQIFIVDGADRIKISTHTTNGTNWDAEWHTVRIHRSVETGDIQVFFDNMKAPVMTANDKRFRWGRVGVGSFDDTSDWARFRLRGTLHQPLAGRGGRTGH